jgi:hypothetical protein
MQIVAVPMLVLTLGLHWALLQSVAWTGMLISYARSGSFQEAIIDTLDGQHPCFLCKIIQNGRTEEHHQDQQQNSPSIKFEPGLIWQNVEFCFTCGSHPLRRTQDCLGTSRIEQPPKPRPRGIPDNWASV